MKTHTLLMPLDMHLHLRDGVMLENVAPLSAYSFSGAIIMPNLVPPVETLEDLKAYARVEKIPGRSGLNKKELRALVEKWVREKDYDDEKIDKTPFSPVRDSLALFERPAGSGVKRKKTKLSNRRRALIAGEVQSGNNNRDLLKTYEQMMRIR